MAFQLPRAVKHLGQSHSSCPLPCPQPRQTADTMSYTATATLIQRGSRQLQKAEGSPRLDSKGQRALRPFLGQHRPGQSLCSACWFHNSLLLQVGARLQPGVSTVPASLCDGTFQILCICKNSPAPTIPKILYIYVCEPCTCKSNPERLEEASDLLEPESQAIIWMLGTKVQSSTRAVSARSHLSRPNLLSLP